MAPLMREEQQQESQQPQEQLASDRFSNCSNDSDSSPSSSHRRVRIRFNHTPQVETIESKDDFTPSELSASWYSGEEKRAMYEDYEKIVMRMEAGRRPKKNTTYRGLENFSETNSAQLDEIVHACIDAVMDDQDRQWAENGNEADWDSFREVSLQVSLQSASLAYKMAEYDEREARKAYIAMAKEEFERQQGKEVQQDDASVGTEVTEVTTSTMAQDVKSNHHKIVSPLKLGGRSKKSSKATNKNGKNRPPKARSSGSRKTLGDALENLNKKKAVYNDKLRDREFQPKVLRVR
ncbi:unnamed protein product [Cylindrotheca closterium]|uniref:Uncharacterized protein n=1 Tax=Cylindrotheca closterium TaxID=2856 RepID=A0AAD2CGW0_9STRA|nr:unnamed protein product [Cylindrotheca closterium]